MDPTWTRVVNQFQSGSAFFDDRLNQTDPDDLFLRFERLGEQAVRVFDRPDAGLWELRGTTRVHTFSCVMCWAACDRLERIAARLGLAERARYWGAHAQSRRGR